MPERVRMVYIINSLGVGGAEVGMCRLLDGLNSEKYDITVVALDGRTNDLADQIPSWVRVIPLYSGSLNLGNLIDFVRAVRESDVLVGSLFHSVIVVKLIGLLKYSGAIATWRHVWPFKTNRRKWIFKRSTRLTDAILADSEAVAEKLKYELRIDDSMVYTVPIAGLNPTGYTSAIHSESSTVTVGTVGRLTEQKNHETILSVAKELQGEGITFEIAGEGELYEKLERIIEEQSITNVALRGFVDDVPQFLADLDLYFQPSSHEGLCITVLEAMAAGLPVVGSDVGGIGRNVSHGETGFLYDPDDVAGFVSAIRTLASDPELRREFGERGQERVSEHYTQNALVSAFEETIDTIL
jgi:glycosyltransferase involved in cell wall biosynthesis